MKWKNMVRNVIPFYGFRKYVKVGASEDEKKGVSPERRFMKGLGHFVYTSAMGIGLLFYGLNALGTREINPLKILEVNQERQELYDKNWKKIFGPNGYADRNGDFILSFPERVEAYRRMGYFKDELPIADEIEFRRPTLKQLGRAVKSYEVERR